MILVEGEADNKYGSEGEESEESVVFVVPDLGLNFWVRFFGQISLFHLLVSILYLPILFSLHH